MDTEQTNFAFPSTLMVSTLEQHGNGRNMKEYTWNDEYQLIWDIQVVFHKLHLSGFLSGVWRRKEKNVWLKVEV